MYQHELIERLYGKDFASKYNSFVDELLKYEENNPFFNEENQIGDYIVMNRDPQLFTVLFKDTLPKQISNDLSDLADSYFK
ncbi:MAG: hypothetical protein Q4G18_10885 [Myroides sp.]|nr:hypothetical protein [Myroides sp.]